MHSSLNFSSANLSFDKRPLRNLSDICKKSCSEDSRGTSALFFVALAEEAVVTTHSFTEMLRAVSIEDLINCPLLSRDKGAGALPAPSPLFSRLR